MWYIVGAGCGCTISGTTMSNISRRSNTAEAAESSKVSWLSGFSQPNWMSFCLERCFLARDMKHCRRCVIASMISRSVAMEEPLLIAYSRMLSSSRPKDGWLWTTECAYNWLPWINSTSRAWLSPWLTAQWMAFEGSAPASSSILIPSGHPFAKQSGEKGVAKASFTSVRLVPSAFCRSKEVNLCLLRVIAARLNLEQPNSTKSRNELQGNHLSELRSYSAHTESKIGDC